MATNAKKPGKWPQFAEGCRDETVVLAKQIIANAKNAQLAILAGKNGDAIVALGDIRDAGNNIVWQMVQATTGLYEESASVQDATARRSRVG